MRWLDALLGSESSILIKRKTEKNVNQLCTAVP